VETLTRSLKLLADALRPAVVFRRLPPVMTMVLSRFVYDRQSGQRVKLVDKMAFPVSGRARAAIAARGS
jgi:hypothetical protein